MSNIVTLKDVIRDLNLEIVYLPQGAENVEITNRTLTRAGMFLLGMPELYNPKRVQMMGLKEAAYLRQLPQEQRAGFLNAFFAQKMPALIVTNNAEVDPELLDAAMKCLTPILRTQTRPARFAPDFYYYLFSRLSPQTTISGSLVEVNGEGVLIIGESGIGKSETALELVKRGHRLVSDDVVNIRLNLDHSLVGTSPALTRHFVEIRGIGIIDVKALHGLVSVKNECRITMAVRLVHWKENESYERLGMDDECETVLGVPLPLTTIPVRHGRNLSFIIETASANTSAKQSGYNPAMELDKNIIEGWKSKSKE